MAQTWVPTLWKRLAIAALNVIAGAIGLSRGSRQAAIDVAGGDVRRILVVELWNIGDVVLTMPFLAQLRVLFPRAKTTLLAQHHARTLLEGTGLVDEFVEMNVSSRDAWLTYNPLVYDWRELRGLSKALRARDFDLAFQCRTHIRERVLVALSGARRRVGFVFAARDRLLTDPITLDDPDRHKIADWLRLLEPFSGPVDAEVPMLHVSESERRWADDYFAERGVSPSDILIGIHPGASLPEKRWPLERFHEVATALVNRAGVRVLAFVEPAGYGASLGQIERVAAANVDLRRLISLIERCDLLVCNDSGPMHIAAALRVPTVAVFGSGTAAWFAPPGEEHELIIVEDAPQRSDDAFRSVDPFALREISVSRVLAAVERAIDRPHASSSLAEAPDAPGAQVLDSRS